MRNAVRLQLAQFAAACVISLVTSRGAAAPARFFHVAYSPGGYALSASQREALLAWAGDAKVNSHAVITIDDTSAHLSAASLAHLVGQMRALRLYEALLGDGHAAARVIVSARPELENRPDEVQLVYSEVETAIVPPSSAVPTAPKPTTMPQAAGPARLEFAYLSGSQVLIGPNHAHLREFLSTADSAGHEALVINGDGVLPRSALWQQALCDARLSRAYYTLSKVGYPAGRIYHHRGNPNESTADCLRDTGGVSAHWTTFAALADQSVPSAPVTAEIANPPDLGKPAGLPVEASLFGGASIPGGMLYDNAKVGGIYGVGLAADFLTLPRFAVRGGLTYAWSQMSPKNLGLRGPLTVNHVHLRADLAMPLGLFRPFVGGAFGVYPWKASIEEQASGLQNASNTTSLGGQLSVGVDIAAAPHLRVGPELSMTRIAGDFNETLWMAGLALRWRS